ncbi:DUF488 domain-containing protein [Candidatus Parcubacteria bacterium]|nr:MAG: DUF488 domain-containing protein [Candidatus Parcubacteria bacterium]
MGDQIHIVTIGVYGFDEAGFFSALTSSRVDTFCDLRRRRGLRGRAYAFANSCRLQKRLAVLGIRYVHIKELAPSPAIRDVQREDDRRHGIGKRERAFLSPAFIQAYQSECLQNLTVAKFRDLIGPDARVVALFCVEREPEACHRSLVADKLADELGIEPEHIRP